MEPILVSTAELEKHLGDPEWIVFDTRHDMGDVGKGRRLYAEAHIPGAYFLHVDDDLCGNFAVRLWWMLRWLGHERVALLDGGYPLWEKEKRPTSKEVPAPRQGDFKPRP